MPIYKLNTTADAVDAVLSNERKKVTYKTFEEGETFLADDYENNDKYIIIKNRYILPKSIVEENKPKKTEDGTDTDNQTILEKAKANDNMPSSFQDIKSKSIAYKNGAVYGAAFGLITGLLLRKKVVLFVVGGALIGGHLSLKAASSNKPKYDII